MDLVQPGTLVLITGVNGHVASSIAHRLLQKGYRVRGTVRAIYRASYIKQSLSQFTESLEICEVPDIAKSGAFDAAIEGVAAVIHTASPVTMDAKRPEEQYVPGIDGTLSIMRSARATPSVKRFLFLGSLGSVVLTAKDPTKEIITGDDWNIVTERAVKNLDDPAIGFHIYVGSKLEAEKAAWGFMSQPHRPSFSLTSILPGMIFGPIFNSIPGPPRQDVSLGHLYDTFAKPPRVDGVTPIVSTPWVHADDVANLFLASLTSDKAGGRRLLACAGKLSWLQVTEILRKVYPDRPYPPSKADAPYMNYPGAEVIQFDTSLEQQLLGGKWRSLDDAILPCARDLMQREEKGWDKF